MASDPDRAPGGRPTLYRDEYADQARKLCELGATDAVLADFFEVSVRTIPRWSARHPAFAEALKVGKAAADDRVERSLYQRAVGYDYVETTAVKVKATGTDERGEKYAREEVETVELDKHQVADTVAAIFWLKNRRPDTWRDVRRSEVTGKDGGPIRTESEVDLSALDEEDLRVLKAMAQRAAVKRGEG